VAPPLRHTLAAVDFTEFDRLVEPMRARSAALQAEYGFALIDARAASAQELLEAEEHLGATLPSQYKTFMMHYGGGQFGLIDLLPVTPIRGDDDIVSVNQRENPAGSFVAIAPVGTGDYWGFPVTNGRCSD
jgi:antitoxin YobK